jgi:beta-lactamase superfamily II metal-dependent hydrolase
MLTRRPEEHHLMQSTKIHFLNVGHGDCTIIEHPSGRLTMIDINNSKSLPEDDQVALAAQLGISLSQFRMGTIEKKSWAQYYEGLLVDPRDYWRDHFAGRHLFRYIQTHPDLDHMGGLASLFWGEKVTLGNFWDYDHDKTKQESDFDNGPHDWNDWLAYTYLRRGVQADGRAHAIIKLLRDETGDYWTEDGLTILGPTPDLIDYCDRIDKYNNSSYVLRLDYGGRRVILPGDAEKPAWDSIEAAYDDADLACDILKAAHHGRESGYSESAVAAMAPDFIICSVGKKPSTDASDEYRSHGATVLSTRYHGTITVQIWADGEIWIDNDAGDRLHTIAPLGPVAA